MRLITTFHDVEKAKKFSSLLKREGIDNQVETHLNADWGSDAYGTVRCDIWIIDEDTIDKASTLLKKYENGEIQEQTLDATPLISTEPNHTITNEIPPPPPSFQQPLGYATFYLIVACILIFFMAEYTAPSIKGPLPKLPLVPLVSSPTKKALLFDYPKIYVLIDELAEKYGIEALNSPQTLPPEGQELYNKVFKTPFWGGLYPIMMNYFQNKETIPQELGPLFEKESQGELWRLVSPIFLHADIFHILFNMLWLLMLGRQMEGRIGSGKLLLFVLITAIFSNVCQYLVGGPNFIGFSGVLCAMLGFIWQRQSQAPWEGYQLQGATIKFMLIFIGGMVCIQFISLLTEAATGTVLTPGIANTAHVTGLIAGLILSRVPYFHLQN